jgi:60 kDa SS-A/Ro ribonucleoprotein
MARINTPVLDRTATHEGGRAWGHTKPEEQLRRSVLSSFLWEREFYEDGESIADRVVRAAEAVTLYCLAELAVEARSKYNLRHMPLLLLSVLARRGKGASVVSNAIARTIQRADELAEFLAVYAKLNGVEPKDVRKKLSAQVKRGLAEAFTKFDERQLAISDRAGAVRLRDVLFLCHAKPKDTAQAEVWKRLVSNQLAVPDTWEVALSAGKDKKATFERLITEGQIGYLALIRNLRNMEAAGCDHALVEQAIVARKGAQRVLPFRYIAAAKAAPSYEPALDKALLASIAEMEPIGGQTVIMVDVSGSMDYPLSAKSDLHRIDAAAALASMFPGAARVFTFSDQLVEVPQRKGMAGVEAVTRSQAHRGTFLGAALTAINEKVPHDRIIVITDEQSQDPVPQPVSMRAYLINVASASNGVGYGPWTHIDGFSEQVFRFITEAEHGLEVVGD